MLVLLILIPLVGAFLTNLRKELGLICCIIAFQLSLYLWLGFDNNELNFQYRFGDNFGIDGIALYLIVLTCFITILLIIGGANDNEYIFWILIAESILIALWSVLDILAFYVLYELILIPLYFIIKMSVQAYPYRMMKINRAINKLMGYTLFGSFMMFIAIILLYKNVGTTNYETIMNSDFEENSIIRIIWFCFFLGFAVKVPIIPLHVWLPEAHSEAPTGGSMLLAGVILKMGSFGMIRYLIMLWPETTFFFKDYINVIFVISILYSSITILRQVEVKKLIAYSSISHMNLSLLGLFSGQFDAILGGYLIMINHGIVSAALFYCAGVLFSRYSLRAIKYYRGLLSSMPIFGVLFFLFNMINIGFPPFGNFISELLIFMGCFKSGIIFSLFASISIMLSGVYGIWFITRILYGRVKPNLGSIVVSNDVTRKEAYILGLLLIISLLLGLYPKILFEGLNLPISLMI